MSNDGKKKFGGFCIDCKSSLELFEVDFEKGKRIMHCKNCNLYHFYKKDFFGNWKLKKAGRVSDLWKSSK